MYKIEFKQSVTKDLRRIDSKFHKNIFSKIDKLKTSPYKANIEQLSGSKLCFRIRAGDYRIVFQILNRDKKIIIQYIRHRKDVYKNL